MDRRALIISLLCVILAIVRISGVHAHLSVDHHSSSDAPVAELQHGADEHAPDHLDAHFAHGDVDVDVAAKGFGKLSSFSLPVALAALIVLFVSAALFACIQRCPAPSSLPKWQRRSYLTPPSQAPPVAA